MADETPADLRGIAERLRGDIFDAVPDDNDMQHILAMAADTIEKIAYDREARERDAAHPDLVPEAVMDAGFASQESWWRPGDSPIVTVLVPGLIESVTGAVYASTREALGVA